MWRVLYTFVSVNDLSRVWMFQSIMIDAELKGPWNPNACWILLICISVNITYCMTLEYRFMLYILYYFCDNFLSYLLSSTPKKTFKPRFCRWHHQSIIINWQLVRKQCQLTNMHIQLAIAMSGIPKWHQKKKGFDELLFENMQCHCNQVAS